MNEQPEPKRTKTVNRSRLRRWMFDMAKDGDVTDDDIKQALTDYLSEYSNEQSNDEQVVPSHITDDKNEQVDHLYAVGVGYDHNRRGWITFTIKTVGDRVVSFEPYNEKKAFLRRKSALTGQLQDAAYKIFRR